MAKYDGINDPVITIQPGTYTADTTGTAATVSNYEENEIAFTVGAVTTADGSNFIELAVLHSDVNTAASFTNCADTDLTATVTGTNTGTIAKIDATSETFTTATSYYIGEKPYVRVDVNETGTASADLGVNINLRRPQFT